MTGFLIIVLYYRGSRLYNYWAAGEGQLPHRGLDRQTDSQAGRHASLSFSKTSHHRLVQDEIGKALAGEDSCSALVWWGYRISCSLRLRGRKPSYHVSKQEGEEKARENGPSGGERMG